MIEYIDNTCTIFKILDCNDVYKSNPITQKYELVIHLSSESFFIDSLTKQDLNDLNLYLTDDAILKVKELFKNI